MDGFPSFLIGFLSLLLFSAFTKILTTLSIFRHGLGLKGGGFGIVLGVVAFALSLLIVAPQIGALGGLDRILGNHSFQEMEDQFRPFLEKHSDKEVSQRFWKLGQQLRGDQSGIPAALGETPNEVLLLSFVLTELKEAFQIGILLLIPFLVIDLVVTNILMLLGVTQLSTEVVSLPLKLLLFLAVDGWTLLSEKLVGTYLQ